MEQGNVVSMGEESGEGVDATLLSDILRYINLAEAAIGHIYV